jgi:hypothetical protein
MEESFFKEPGGSLKKVLNLGASSDGSDGPLDSFFPPPESSAFISDSACCISKMASSQKSTKHSSFSLSPPSVMVA